MDWMRTSWAAASRDVGFGATPAPGHWQGRAPPGQARLSVFGSARHLLRSPAQPDGKFRDVSGSVQGRQRRLSEMAAAHRGEEFRFIQFSRPLPSEFLTTGTYARRLDWLAFV